MGIVSDCLYGGDAWLVRYILRTSVEINNVCFVARRVRGSIVGGDLRANNLEPYARESLAQSPTMDTSLVLKDYIYRRVDGSQFLILFFSMLCNSDLLCVLGI